MRVSRFSVENTLSHSSEKFRRRILQCLISFGYRETLGLRGGVGGLRFSVEVVFVSEYRNISQMNLSVMVFRNYPVAKKFMDKSGEGYQGFPSNIFCLTLPKIFVGGTFSVSLIPGIDKFDASEGFVTIFCQKDFVSLAKIFVEELFCGVFQKFSGSEKFYG